MFFFHEFYEKRIKRFENACENGLLRSQTACEKIGLSQEDVEYGIAAFVGHTMNESLREQSDNDPAGLTCYRSERALWQGVEDYAWFVIEEICMTHEAAPGLDDGDVLAWLPLIDVHTIASRLARLHGVPWVDYISEDLEDQFFDYWPDLTALPSPPAQVERRFHHIMIDRWRTEVRLLLDAVRNPDRPRNPSHPDPYIYKRRHFPIKIEVRSEYSDPETDGDSSRSDDDLDDASVANQELINFVEELVRQMDQQPTTASPGTAGVDSMSSQPEGQGPSLQESDVSSAPAEAQLSSVAPSATPNTALQADDSVGLDQEDHAVDAPTSGAAVNSPSNVTPAPAHPSSDAPSGPAIKGKEHQEEEEHEEEGEGEKNE